MKSMNGPLALGAVAALGFFPTSAHASVIEVIYTKFAGHPKAIVPGALDLSGNPLTTEFRAMEDLIGSPDGTHWMLKGRTQQGSDGEVILMIGSGNVGSVFAQRGQPVHGGAPGEVYDFIGSGVGRFNEANDFVFTARAMPTNRHKVIRSIGGVASVFMKQDDPYLGLIDNPPSASGDELVGNSVGSAHLLNDGTVGLQDSTIQNIHSSRRPGIFYNNQKFHQRGITTVVGLNGIGTEIVGGLTANSFYSTPNFQPISLGEFGRWLVRGQVDQQANQNVLIVDEKVVIQQGNAIPGTSVIVNTIVHADVAANGDWYARGTIVGGGAWAVRNGQLLAVTNDVVPGQKERWGTSFYAVGGNRNGDWFLAGTTDNADNTQDEVIVVNGVVVVREGQAVDLSGDGSPDNNAFIGRAVPTLAALTGNNVFLSDDKVLYFIANLHDGNGNDLASNPVFTSPTAFMRIDLNAAPPCLADLNASGAVDVQDLLILLGSWGPCGKGECPADLNDSGSVDVQDLLILLGAWGPCP
ncbi:MAG TPA: hypothetical protein PK400_06290 [Phycisphaerales bacterium]|nr:hypothetical protein [Phycisphaerales bacterium]HRQ76471.1 hypothetical protein [Phycisphaerales bacterium]